MTARQKKMMMESTLDDFTTRLRHSRHLSHVFKRKQRLAKYLAALCLLSVVVVIVQVELRLRVLDHGTSAPAADLLPINILRGVSVFLTLLLEVLLLLYAHTTFELLHACKSTINWSTYFELALMALVCLMGTIPPGVETTVAIPLMKSDGVEDLIKDNFALIDGGRPRWHVDQLGALVLLRLPLIINWLVSVYVITSPAYIAWQYNVEVTPMFRVKYLYTQYPFPLVALVFLSSWLSGTFGMHILEYAFEPSLATWLFASFDIMTGTGWSVALARTLLGRLLSVLCALLGILCIAVLTATLCGASELDATEVWLIRSIQQRQANLAKSRYAIDMIEKAFLIKRAIRRREEGGDSATHRATIRRHRAALTQSLRLFKRARLSTDNGMQVANVKTLYGLMCTLQADQRTMQATLAQLATKVDELAAPSQASRAEEAADAGADSGE